MSSVEQEILAAGGRVPLARFMELALSHPAEGYYARHASFVGPRGDFSTIPQLSPEFCQAVARLGGELLASMVAAADEGQEVALIELGPGEGALVRTLTAMWENERPELKDRVGLRLVEISETLRRRQGKALTEAVSRGWRVRWFPSVQEACLDQGGATGRSGSRGKTGGELRLVIANEFIDSLPVHLVRVELQEPDSAALREAAVREEATVVEEAFVETVTSREGPADGRGETLFAEVWREVTEEARTELALLFGCLEGKVLSRATTDGFVELRPAAGRLLAQLTEGAQGVCLLTIDYGEWFGLDNESASSCTTGCRAQPYRRTLRGYFRHRRVEDILVRVGRQDLTADVDFRALDVHGRLLGYETLFCVTLAEFLRGDSVVHGGEVVARRSALEFLEADRRATILQALLDPADLGGAFKVMLQAWERSAP
ncbi:MAG: SAM-dependent methyltransferase [Thermoleophilia bacterium]|nr:SAM-dependent methyltransferase [Thermoleophilia bacterium]